VTTAIRRGPMVAKFTIEIDRDRAEIFCVIGRREKLVATIERSWDYERRRWSMPRTTLPAWEPITEEYGHDTGRWSSNILYEYAECVRYAASVAFIMVYGNIRCYHISRDVRLAAYQRGIWLYKGEAEDGMKDLDWPDFVDAKNRSVFTTNSDTVL
jgi:hypothetical protein